MLYVEGYKSVRASKTKRVLTEMLCVLWACGGECEWAGVVFVLVVVIVVMSAGAVMLAGFAVLCCMLCSCGGGCVVRVLGDKKIDGGSLGRG